MKTKINNLKTRLLKDDKMIFYVVSIVFFVILSFINIENDDVNGTQLIEHSLRGYYVTVSKLYQTWMSRVFVIAAVLFFRNHHQLIWAVFMGISMYVMLEAISMLFVRKNQKENNNFIACIVMLFPFGILNTAGWISTMTTYFSTMAFGFMALVPIGKIIREERFHWWEYILYSLSALYSTSNEQVMVVVLGCYIVANVYFLFKKRIRIFWIIQLLIVIFNMVLTVACPGSANRSIEEIASWYPEYGMLDLLDKLDLGFFSTLNWLLYDSHAFVIVICTFLCFFIWKKYNEKIIRLFSLIPVIVVVGLGPLSSITTTMWPFLSYLKNDISKYGLVTTENRGNMVTFMQFFVMSITICLILMEIYLLANSIEEIIIPFSLLFTGFASRLVLGFSPTIWASGYRTCTVMTGCILISFIYVSIKQAQVNLIDDKIKCKLKYILNAGIVIAFINLCGLVAATFA